MDTKREIDECVKEIERAKIIFYVNLFQQLFRKRVCTVEE